jgi:tryptophan synthase alpha chain
MGVTGVRDNIDTDLESIIREIRSVTNTPVAIGFGISAPDQAKALGSISDGVIVGSAIVKIIERYGQSAAPYIYDYVKSMKSALY